MNREELKSRGGSVTHSHYTLKFDVVYPNWTEFMQNLGKQLDDLEVSMNDVAKITWEGDVIRLSCIKMFEINDGKIKRIE